MGKERRPSRVVWTLAVCTALALFGDATMYAVLPSQYSVVGVQALHVGWLLSVNRLVRLPLNLMTGWLSDRLGPKLPYTMGITLGVCSTAGYGLFKGFWPLLALRALWGVAWALLVVAAYGMILDVTTERTRGRLTGIYTSCSYFGGAVGTLLGGLLVDRLGFSSAMLVLGACTSLGCLGALTLPRTRQRVQVPLANAASVTRSLVIRLELFRESLHQFDARLLLIATLNFAHRFFFAGVFYATFGFYLHSTLGEEARIGSLAIGIASLTAVLLFARSVLTVMAAPGLGHLSDHLCDRSRVLLLGEALGMSGLSCFAVGSSFWLVGAGVLFVAIVYGVVPSLLVAWMGDLTSEEGRGQILGIFQTMGDLGSGLGPLVAYALLPLLGIGAVYGLSAGFLALTIPLILKTRGWK